MDFMAVIQSTAELYHRRAIGSIKTAFSSCSSRDGCQEPYNPLYSQMFWQSERFQSHFQGWQAFAEREIEEISRFLAQFSKNGLFSRQYVVDNCCPDS